MKKVIFIKTFQKFETDKNNVNGVIAKKNIHRGKTIEKINTEKKKCLKKIPRSDTICNCTCTL